MSASFPAATLDALREARTVVVETSLEPDGPVHEAIIWIVVDREDRVLVRSVRGRQGRWFRELLAHPDGTVRAGATWIVVRAEPAADPERIAACSDALSVKYRGSRASLESMLRDEVLDATLELRPA